MKLTENFSLSEFRSKDNAPFPDEVLNNIIQLANALQIIRNELKVRMDITSGYRSPDHTKSLIKKGVKTSLKSYHVKGMAADFKANGIHPLDVVDIIEKLISEGKIPQGGLKAYRSWVHYDIRGTRARW